MKTKMTEFKVDYNNQTITAKFNNKQTLHLEFDKLEQINNIIGSYYSSMGEVLDHYELYLHLVPFTIESKPVYL